jgi:hypothetical protein
VSSSGAETMVVRGELQWSGDTRCEMLGVGMAARCAAVFLQGYERTTSGRNWIVLNTGVCKNCVCRREVDE